MKYQDFKLDRKVLYLIQTRMMWVMSLIRIMKGWLKTQLKKLLDADIWINVYVFKGNEGETMSGRMGRKIQRRKAEGEECKWCHFMCRVVLKPLALIFGQDKHCEESIKEKYRR